MYHCASRFPWSSVFRPQAALKSAKLVVDRLLDRERDNNGGKYPETIALVLWGTDNIKTYGESLAQVRSNSRGRACVTAMQLLSSPSC